MLLVKNCFTALNNNYFQNVRISAVKSIIEITFFGWLSTENTAFIVNYPVDIFIIQDYKFQ